MTLFIAAYLLGMTAICFNPYRLIPFYGGWQTGYRPGNDWVVNKHSRKIYRVTHNRD